MVNTFEKQIVNTPTSVGKIILTFMDDPTNLGNTKSGFFKIEVLNQYGQFQRTVEGDLVPYLTSAQITAIVGFLDAIRTKSGAELL